MNVHVSLASWPGLRHEVAAEQLRHPPSEPLFGKLSVEHVQLVPQSFGILSEDLVDSLRAAHPATRFRLHANVRVLQSHRQADLSDFAAQQDWFDQAARIHRRLGAAAYTAHSGRRDHSTLSTMFENARRCADLFGCPVGVEGQYPTEGDGLLVSDWLEYRALFSSGVPYALDLSHINILAVRSGQCDRGLLTEMLACERCIEVHVSGNDGQGDQHRVCDGEPWWSAILQSINPDAIVFSEGNHRSVVRPTRPPSSPAP